MLLRRTMRPANKGANLPSLSQRREFTREVQLLIQERSFELDVEQEALFQKWNEEPHSIAVVDTEFVQVLGGPFNPLHVFEIAAAHPWTDRAVLDSA
jgi:hypothetical protein